MKIYKQAFKYADSNITAPDAVYIPYRFEFIPGSKEIIFKVGIWESEAHFDSKKDFLLGTSVCEVLIKNGITTFQFDSKTGNQITTTHDLFDDYGFGDLEATMQEIYDKFDSMVTSESDEIIKLICFNGNPLTNLKAAQIVTKGQL